jgi:hypothetical protein
MGGVSASEVNGGLQVRRVATYVERIESETPDAGTSVSKAWAAAVIVNPRAGHPCADLTPFILLGEQLGEQLGERLGRHALAALGCAPTQVSSYGKGAIVGSGSQIELGAAILHPRLGRPLRALLGQGKAIIPSTIKLGAPGAHLDVPLHGTDDEWNFALLDSMEVTVPGAPGYDEIVVVVALASGGRAFARVQRIDAQ